MDGMDFSKSSADRTNVSKASPGNNTRLVSADTPAAAEPADTPAVAADTLAVAADSEKNWSA